MAHSVSRTTPPEFAEARIPHASDRSVRFGMEEHGEVSLPPDQRTAYAPPHDRDVERWVDLIADIIVDDVRRELQGAAHAPDGPGTSEENGGAA